MLYAEVEDGDGGPKSAGQRVYVAVPTIHQGKKIDWRRPAQPTRELMVPS